MKNEFWIDVLKVLIKFSEKSVSKIDEDLILQTPIFHNKNIKIDGKDIYYDTWFRKGIRFINDLIKENGTFLDQEEFSEIFRIQTNYFNFGE